MRRSPARCPALVTLALALGAAAGGARPAAAQSACDPIQTMTGSGSFGRRVAFARDNHWPFEDRWLFVSAPDAGANGQVHIYREQAGVWELSYPTLEPPDWPPPDTAGMPLLFGWAMDADGPVTSPNWHAGWYVLAVGAPGYDSDADAGTDSGAVYVRSYNTYGDPPWSWSRLPFPTALDSSVEPQFGSAVAVAGSAIVAGAPGAERDDNGSPIVNAGAAFMESFDLADAVPGGLPANARFGSQVAVGGGWIAVAAPGMARVFLFRYASGSWTLRGFIEEPAPTFNNYLSLSIDGDTLAIGKHFFFGEGLVTLSIHRLDPATNQSGWVEELDDDDNMYAADVEGDRAVLVGSNNTVRLFERQADGTWAQTRVVDPPFQTATFAALTPDEDEPAFEQRLAVGGIETWPADGAVYLYAAPLNDCNGDCIDDDGQLAGNDCNGSGVHDECESDQWLGANGIFGAAANWAAGIVPTAHAAVTNGPSGLPSTCTVSGAADVCTMLVAGQPGAEQKLEVTAAQTLLVRESLTIGTDGRLTGGGTVAAASGATGTSVTNQGTIEGGGANATLTIAMPAFTNAAGATLQPFAAAGSGIVIDAPAVTQSGDVFCMPGTAITFTAPVANNGLLSVAGMLNMPSGSNAAGAPGPPPLPSGVSLNGGTMWLTTPAGILTNTGAIAGYGDINRQGPTSNVILINAAGAALAVDDGTSQPRILNVNGKVQNDGTIFIAANETLVVKGLCGNGVTGPGTFVCCASPGGGEGPDFGFLDVSGDLDLEAPATLDAPAGDVRVTGDIRIRIDDPGRFDMATARLSLDGVGFYGGQELELLSPDGGPLYDPGNPPPYFVGELRLGPNPAAVTLVDPGESGRTLYAGELVFEAGTQLDLAGHTVYALATSPADPSEHVIDSVGGGQIVLLEPLECSGDLDGDGTVAVNDLVLLILDWGAGGTPADLNQDGTVDVDDLVELILLWGPC